jgi:Bacterial membrane protein YfhO
MNSPLLKKAIPHFIAIVIFVLVAIVYCKPALEGKVLSQSDVISYTAMNHQTSEFYKQHGRFPLWTESMFSGMPTYTTGGIIYRFTFLSYLKSGLTLGLPAPISLFFAACICFYILTQVLRLNPWIGVLSALAYAYSTFDPIIITVGHITQMEAIAYAPAVVAGLLLVFQQKYFMGASLLILFVGLQAESQHLQVIYYTLIILAFVTVAWLVECWKQKNTKTALKGIAIAMAAGLIGVCTYAVTMLPLLEYSKETVRGGKSKLSGDNKNKSKGGLDKDYAFKWSYGIPETLTIFVPGAFGGGTSGKEITSDSKMADKLSEVFGVPEETGLRVANESSYWGSQGQPQLRTAGPVYLGAVICFLFIFGMVYVKSWHKGWILGAAFFGILLAWGKNFSGFNYLLFDYLPFYNKFRSPTMALVIPQLAFPLLAALGLDQLLSFKEPKEMIWKKFKTACLITGCLLALTAMLYLSADFKSPDDQGMKESFTGNLTQQMARGKGPTPEIQQQANEAASAIVKGLQSDRKAIFEADFLRSFLFVALAVLLTGLYLKDKIKPVILLAGLLILSSYDLLAEGRKYLNDDKFGDAADIESSFAPTPADQLIQRDPDKNFRVYDLSDEQNGAFNNSRTSYYHNSIGGYHPAKLGLYQDLIENQLSKGNMMVFNMLNTKYFIQNNPATRQPEARVNPNAFGPCWLVKVILYVNSADEEMKALDSVNVKDTAIVLKEFQKIIKFLPVKDSTASIKLIENLIDQISYKFSAKTNQFAVFSEVYYDKGWNAYLDGKKTDYCRVDYVLRGMPVPAGDHKIEFRFESHAVELGKTISFIASLLALVAFLYILGGFLNFIKTVIKTEKNS